MNKACALLLPKKDEGRGYQGEGSPAHENLKPVIKI